MAYEKAAQIEDQRTIRFWRRANFFGLGACLVALPADLAYTTGNRTGVLVARALMASLLLLWAMLRPAFVLRHLSHLCLLMTITIAASMGYITINTRGPETLYFMGIVEVILATLLVGKIGPLYAALNCAFGFLIYLAFLIYGGYIGRTFVPGDSFSAALLSLAIFLTLAFFLNLVIVRYRKLLEREFSEKLHILSNVEDAIFSLDSAMRLLEINDAGIELLRQIGETPEHLQGRDMRQIFPELSESRLFRLIDRAVRRAEPVALESYFPILDKYFSVRIVPFHSGVILYFHDTSDFVRRGELERRARAEAENRDHFKTRLIAVMNHELRAPLLSMLTNAQVIQLKSSDRETLDIAAAIISMGKTAQGLIRYLLDYSTVELGRPLLPPDVSSDVGEILREASEIVAPTRAIPAELVAQTRGIAVRCEKIRAVQVLVNLLDNAGKYATDGRVHFGFRLRPRSIVFEIGNQTAADPAKIRFRLLERSRDSEHGDGARTAGYGLGLYITRNILDTIGGYITVERKQELLVFTVELPLASTESGAIAETAALPV